MKRVNAIIVDDEEGGISNLKYYLTKYCPTINIVAAEHSIEQIESLFNNTEFDLAFLDIELWDTDIFSFLLETTVPKFEIVFVTAHEQYALKAFNVNVLDYVLKPLRKSDIVNCYQKVLRRFRVNVNEEEPITLLDSHKREDKPIILKQGNQVYIVPYNDIVYFKAKGSYTDVCFYYKKKKVIVTISKHLNQYENMHATGTFYRVHRSYIINTNEMVSIVKQKSLKVKMSTDEYIPVAKRRSVSFLSSINST